MLVLLNCGMLRVFYLVTSWYYCIVYVCICCLCTCNFCFVLFYFCLARVLAIWVQLAGYPCPFHSLYIIFTCMLSSHRSRRFSLSCNLHQTFSAGHSRSHFPVPVFREFYLPENIQLQTFKHTCHLVLYVQSGHWVAVF